MENIIIIIVVILILALAVGYIIREKKKGAKCVGCPHSKECASAKSNVGSNCGCDEK